MVDYYVFRVTSYDSKRLLPQISKALELRMDLLSREKYPRIWSLTDRLRGLTGGKVRSKTRSRIMGVLYIILGTFLVVPGLMNSEELRVPFLIGAIGIVAGILNLWFSRKNRKNPFDESAKMLLASKENLTAEQGIEVIFGEDGMDIPNENGIPEVIYYENFECAVEGPDLFLFVFDDRGTVLQKRDLDSGHLDDFWEFISRKVPNSISFA